MPIYRSKRKQNQLTQINSAPLGDSEISWKARGILALLLTLPEGCTVNEADLINLSDKDGRDALRSGLQELRDAGYIVKATNNSIELNEAIKGGQS